VVRALLLPLAFKQMHTRSVRNCLAVVIDIAQDEPYRALFILGPRSGVLDTPGRD